MDNIKKRIIFQGAVSQFELDPFGIHGVNHWHAVYRNCCQIWANIHDVVDIPHAEGWFFWNFAMLHDCCRTSDGPDPAHGINAAKLIPDDDSEFNKKLRSAVMGHTAGKTTHSEWIGICWDADRLELPRVAIKPDPNLMSTDVGKAFAESMLKTMDIIGGPQ